MATKGASNVLIQQLLAAEEEAEKIVTKARESKLTKIIKKQFGFIFYFFINFTFFEFLYFVVCYLFCFVY